MWNSGTRTGKSISFEEGRDLPDDGDEVTQLMYIEPQWQERCILSPKWSLVADKVLLDLEVHFNLENAVEQEKRRNGGIQTTKLQSVMGSLGFCSGSLNR